VGTLIVAIIVGLVAQRALGSHLVMVTSSHVLRRPAAACDVCARPLRPRADRRVRPAWRPFLRGAACGQP
jgi:hypothetical protein